MGSPSRYWILCLLNPAGGWRSLPQAIAQTHFQTTFPQFVTEAEPRDKTIQTDLIAAFRADHPDQTAGLCLRCFISHGTLQVCFALVKQFGTYHGFHLDEILPIVLDDDGAVPLRPYPSVARQVLHSFDPDRASLSTWTSRLVRQHRDLNAFFLQCGFYQISDWALLNDTRVEQLPRILSEFHHLSHVDLQKATTLLASYRAVYLRDRQQQPTNSRCPAPTPAQLQEIAQTMQQQISPPALLQQLERLSQYLRDYRIVARGGKLHYPSMADPGLQEKIEYTYIQGVAADADSAEAEARESMFQTYETQFEIALDQALQQVINHRLQLLKKTEKQQRFLAALRLYYQQRCTMTTIATQLNLRGQDAVTKLLRLKAFRADVKRHMLQTLQNYVREQSKGMIGPDQLDAIMNRLDAVLQAEVEALMTEEQKQATTPKDYTTQSRFARQLCVCLEQNRH